MRWCAGGRCREGPVIAAAIADGRGSRRPSRWGVGGADRQRLSALSGIEGDRAGAVVLAQAHDDHRHHQRHDRTARAAGVANRLMREVGPISPDAPAFPHAATGIGR